MQPSDSDLLKCLDALLKEFNEKFATRESFLAFESMWLAMNPWVYLEKQAVKSTEFLLH